MAAAKLTGNAVAAAMAGDTNLKPVVQVVDLRSIAVTGAPGSGPRFRAIISDGVATGHALFASQLCDLARSGVVRRGSVVQLLDYIVNNVGPTRNRKYLSPLFSPLPPLPPDWIDVCSIWLRSCGFGLWFRPTRLPGIRNWV